MIAPKSFRPLIPTQPQLFARIEHHSNGEKVDFYFYNLARMELQSQYCI